MVGPGNEETRYQYDDKSFFAGYRAGCGIKGHGQADAVPDGSASLPSALASEYDGDWKYDNRSFKLGLAVGFALHVPGQGKGNG